MPWMLWVMAAFGVIEPFEHQLGGCGRGKELRLEQGGHGLKKLAHWNPALKLISLAARPCCCACCFKTGCCFVVDVSFLNQRLRKSFSAAETFLPGTLFLRRQ